jgi:hypothetical protein
MLRAQDLYVIQRVDTLCARTRNFVDISLTRTFLLQFIVAIAHPPCCVPTSTPASVYESASCISFIFFGFSVLSRNLFGKYVQPSSTINVCIICPLYVELGANVVKWTGYFVPM